MVQYILKWFDRKLPQNFILKRPLPGAFILSVFFFCFLMIYKPFNIHPARAFSLGITMLAYSLTLFFAVFGMANLLKRIPVFSGVTGWTLGRELLAILLMFMVIGLTIYCAGFFIEVKADRWNLRTFLNSFIYSLAIGIIPFAFFTFSNFRFIFFPEIEQLYNTTGRLSIYPGQEKPIEISSQLKKENLSFYPDQFVFAESDGNYIDFYLIIEGNLIKRTIRNSISNIEEQLSTVTTIMRIHRAFIVNLKKVNSKTGSSLGYRLKLEGSESEIPVSRKNTRDFDRKMQQIA